MNYISNILCGLVLLLCSSLSSASVIITEVDPESEFIELYNSGNEEIDLSGWTWSELTGSGTEKTYEIASGHIAPLQFFVIETSRKINDTGDTISLYLLDTSLVDTITIPKKEEGFSYQLQSGLWKWDAPTKGSENIESEEQDAEDEESEDEIEESEEGEGEDEGEEEGEEEYEDKGDDEDEESEETEEITVVEDEETSQEFIDDQTDIDTDTSEDGETENNENTEENEEDIQDEENNTGEDKIDEEAQENTDATEHQDDTTEDTPIEIIEPLIISEVLPNPEGSDAEHEFFELYNPNQTDKNMHLWKMVDASGKEYIFPENTILSAQEYRAFYSSETNVTLNNSDESLTLFSPDENEEAYIEYTESTEGQSIITDPETGLAQWTPFTTPNNPTIFPTYSDQIHISEILPNPEGADTDETEWIELHNSGEEDIDLQDWILKDASGKSFQFPEETILSPNEYKVFFKSETGITLNNSDESVTLINPLLETVNSLSFSESATEGHSFAISENKRGWTSSPTPHQENIFSGYSSSSHSNATPIPTPLADHANIQMLITQIAPYETDDDFIEVHCVQCEGNTAGITLSIGSKTYSIPEEIEVSTNDIIRFVFDHPTKTQPEKTLNRWVLFVGSSGLTTIDETISLSTNTGRILDIVCYANQNGTFSTSDVKVMGQATLQQQWSGELKEHGCLDSSAFTRGSRFIRIDQTDTHTKDDFLRTKEETVSTVQPLHISTVELSELHSILTLKNTGVEALDMNGWYIANMGKWMMDISKEEMILEVNQEIILQIDPTKAKKYRRENMMLEIRSPAGEITDVFCINLSKTTEEKEKAMKIIQPWAQKGLWKKERKQSWCAEYYAMQEIHTYSRSEYIFPSSLKAYAHTVTQNLKTKEQGAHTPENILHDDNEKKDEKTAKEEKEEIENIMPTAYSLNHTITPLGLTLSGTAEKDTHTILFSIPSKNITWKTKTSRDSFSHTLPFPLKKGRYIVLSEEYTKDGTLIASHRETILLTSPALPNSLAFLEIATVLPNPEGKDSGNESLALHNPLQKAGWIRNWTIEMDTGTRVTEKKIPSFFTEAQSTFSIPPQFLPTLKNTNTTLRIKNEFGHIISEVSWEKARNGEFFGVHAPVYIAPQKTSTVKKSTSSKKASTAKPAQTPSSQAPQAIPKTAEYAGVIVKRSGNMITVLQENNLLVQYTIPEYLAYSDTFFKEQGDVTVFYTKGVLHEVVPQLSSIHADIFALGGGESEPSHFPFALFPLVGGVCMFLAQWQRKRSMR